MLVARYTEPWRHYHVLAHIGDCLRELDRARELAERPDEIEIALWFHDAVYVPGRRDNEAASAALAEETLAEGGIEKGVRERVRALILATRHDAVPTDADARLMVDIDLAILGADPYRFGIYDRAIRQEFASLSPAEFARGRALVLRSFLARPAIYQTERFRTRCEARARANLTAALAPLGQPAPIDPASPAH